MWVQLPFLTRKKLLIISQSGQRPGLRQSVQHLGTPSILCRLPGAHSTALRSLWSAPLWSWCRAEKTWVPSSSSTPLSLAHAWLCLLGQFLLLEWSLRLLYSNTFSLPRIKLNSPNLFIDHWENTREMPPHKCWIPRLLTDQSLSEWFKINSHKSAVLGPGIHLQDSADNSFLFLSQMQ